MRRLGFLVIFFIYSVKCIAQKEGDANQLPRNEIGLHIFSYSLPAYADKYGRIFIDNEDQKPFHVLNGISYKRHINQHIIRASFSYRNLKNDIYSKWTTGDYDEYILKPGYERELTKTKLTPYLAADFGLYYLAYQGSLTMQNSFYSYNLHGFGAGISPALGVKFKVCKNLSFNAESCLDLVYFKFNHKESSRQFPNENYSSHKFNTIFNPLQKFSVNALF